MANYDVLKVDGSKSGSVELSDSVFAIEPNNSVLFGIINLQRASLRQELTQLKIVQLYVVADVNHGDKRYRTCASRYCAPQWRGGGIVFGPTPEVMHTKCLRKCVV